jgi:hypothetical protein
LRCRKIDAEIFDLKQGRHVAIVAGGTAVQSGRPHILRGGNYEKAVTEVHTAATQATERLQQRLKHPGRRVARRYDPRLSEILHPLRQQDHQGVP